MTQPLFYVAPNRFPTEKAHGYQIVKMCEAFSSSGFNVTLLHPRRWQKDPTLRESDVFTYYRVARSFDVLTLPYRDFMWLERYLPHRVFAVLYWLSLVVWSFLAVRKVRHVPGAIGFTRDIRVACFFAYLQVPFIFEIHTLPGSLGRWLHRFVLRARSLLLVVPITTPLASALEALGASRDRICMLSDAVDPRIFDGVPPRLACRRRLQIPESAFVVGYIGRFSTMGHAKGVQRVLGACAMDGDIAEPPMTFLGVGATPDETVRYRALAQSAKLPDARALIRSFVPRDEVPAYIRCCDVVTIPWEWSEFSAYFTSPLKLFEYMASGVPIVASDLPSLRDILVDRKNALLVPAGDERALYGALAELRRDPELAQRLRAQALQDVQRYTWRERAAEIFARGVPPTSVSREPLDKAS